MKLWTVGFVVLALEVGVLVGMHLPDDCAHRLDGPPPPPAPAPPPPPRFEPLSGAESRYVAALHARSDHFNVDDQALIGLGRGVCQSISQVKAARALVSQGISPADLRVVVDAATSTLCPELRPRVATYLAGGSAT